MMDKKQWTPLGYCRRPHGLKGEVVYCPFGDEIFIESKTRLLLPLPGSLLPGEGQIFHLRSIRGAVKKILSFKNLSSVEDVQKLLPFSVCVDKNALPKGHPALLVGLPVECRGAEMGIVHSWYDNKGQIVLCIQGDDSYELPFVEVFFPMIGEHHLEMVTPKYL